MWRRGVIRMFINILLLTSVRLGSVSTASRSASSAQCDMWLHIVDEIQANLFNDGACRGRALEAVRLTFHDAVGRSSALQASGAFGGGGADGSILKYADIELADPANKGLEGIVYALKHVADNHAVSYGDIIQLAGAVAISSCPGSPRLPFYVGRADAIAPSPAGLVPSPADSADKLLARMADAGFTAAETVALLAAHSIAYQKTTDPSIPETPLDTTPAIFDSQFYLETLLKGIDYLGQGRGPAEAESPSMHEFRLASDAALARHGSTACEWQRLVDDHSRLQSSFRGAMVKLANQGHGNLVNCSYVIPTPASWGRRVKYPSGKNRSDIEQVCTNIPFPDLH